MKLPIRLLFPAVSLLIAAPSAAAELPAHAGWRNDGSGVFPGAKPPLEWSAKSRTDKSTRNIAWHTAVGSSYSSPVVVGDRVFLSAEPDKLVCVARDDGKILWQATNNFGDLPPALHAEDPKLQSRCGYTTPTPVSDGKNIYVVLGTGIVASYDLDGSRNWITYLQAEQTSPYGRSASPCLVDGLLIAPLSTLHALDAQTGKVVWKSADAEGGYGAPAVLTAGGAGGTKVLITSTGLVVRARDGKILAKEIGVAEYASPVVNGDTVYFVSTRCSAVKISAKGADEIEAKELWNADLEGEFFASPVLADGWLYSVNKDGVYYVIDAGTGKKTLSGPLRLPPAGQAGEPTGTFAYPSLSLAGGRLYVGNTKGDWELLDPASRADLNAAQIRMNVLPDGSPACPAFSEKQIFVRVGAELYCVQGK